MIIEFSVSNYRSIKDRQTLSLVATKSSELREENTFPSNRKTRLVKTAVIYGANASGKSNLFKALTFFFRFAVTSAFKQQIGESIRTDPFLFDKASIKEPSEFEIIFLVDNVRYRYGFTVDSEKVHTEWLFAVLNVQEVKLYSRVYQEIDISNLNFKEGISRKEFVRENTTFISVCAQHNGEIAKKVIDYFRTVTVLSGLSDNPFASMDMLDDETRRNEIMGFLRFADIHIVGLKPEQKEVDLSTIPDPELREFLNSKFGSKAQRMVTFGHAVYDGENPVGVEYLEPKDESSGTMKLFEYAGPILRALKTGATLFIDEFDSRLHPLLLEGIIKLFVSPEPNPRNVQLVVSCHAVNILTNRMFRRDQIWFCEKKSNGATELYSLVEYDEPVRKDASFGKNYLLGKYGAVPYLGDIFTQTECSG